MASNSLPAWQYDTHFRSHLEARRAIFFTELGIEWDYEPDGRNTDGSWYLPDFMVLPALGPLWVEVKPTWDNDPAGILRFRRFAAQRPQPSRAALVVGTPAPGQRALVIGGDESSGDPLQGPWEDDGYEWRPCPSGKHFDLAWPGRFRAKFADDGCPDSFGGDGEDRLAAAIRSARCARFDKQPPRTAA